VVSIAEINKELASLEMDKIVEKSKIPVEGESELIK
jgi:hypothetical protein